MTLDRWPTTDTPLALLTSFLVPVRALQSDLDDFYIGHAITRATVPTHARDSLYLLTNYLKLMFNSCEFDSAIRIKGRDSAILWERNRDRASGGQFWGFGVSHKLIRSWKGRHRHEKLLCRFLCYVTLLMGIVGFAFYCFSQPSTRPVQLMPRGERLGLVIWMTRGEKRLQVGTMEVQRAPWGGTTPPTSTWSMCDGVNTGRARALWLWECGV